MGKAAWYLKQLAPLVGGMIIGLTEDISDDEGFFGLIVHQKDGSTVVVWFYRDDEGNGPGSFIIDDME